MMNKMRKVWSVLLCAAMLISMLSVVASAAGAPVITKQPVDVTLTESGDAVFTLTATGEDLTYEWYYLYGDSERGDHSLIEDFEGFVSGASTNTLTLHNVDCSANTYLHCHVINEEGKALSDVVELNVAHENLTFAYTREDHLEVCTFCGEQNGGILPHNYGNDTVCDDCGFDSANPVVCPMIIPGEYKWDYFGNTNEDLVLSVAAYGMDLSYQWYLDDVPIDEVEGLTVEGADTDTLTVKAYPTMCELSNRSFYCVASNSESEYNMSVYVYIDHDHSSEDWEITPHHHIQYCVCGEELVNEVHSDRNGDKLCDTCDFDFEEAGAPVITVNPEDTNTKNGEDIVIKVEATGTDLTYQWYYGWDEPLEGETSATLTIESVYDPENGVYDCANASSYYCIISNDKGSVRSNYVWTEIEHEALDYYEGYDYGHDLVCVCGNYMGYERHNDADKDLICDDCDQQIVHPFKDIVNTKAWYYDAVYTCKELEIFIGDEKGNFNPLRNITRGEVMVVFARQIFSEEFIKEATDQEFEEVLKELAEFFGTGELVTIPDAKKSSYYYRHAQILSALGVIQGDENGNFNGGKLITRQELAVMLQRFCKAFFGELFEEVTFGDSVDSYKDEATVAKWAKDAVEWAKETGLFQGDDLGNFNPANQATRAEMAQLIARTFY